MHFNIKKIGIKSMDIELAKTFLDIARSGSFIATAERLHVTQTTVTARIKNLEAQLGCQLFVRNRAGASLTPEGERFVSYAMQIVQLWGKAKFDVPLPEAKTESISVGGELALWNPLLLNWISDLRSSYGALAIQVETGEASSLISRVSHGVLDVALVYRPEYLPGLKIELLLEEKLVMVSAAIPEPYIYVDWGPVYEQQHDSAFPGKRRAELSIDFGLLALEYLLQRSGTGYFRARVVQRYIEEDKLFLVPNAPEFIYPIYAIYRDSDTSETVHKAIENLRAISRQKIVWR
ncbi:LysR family transcriptional regulator [Cellvibrio sp. pealriver]|uniref:LysR family transcriptional regulator n=1 Tax=Cellvibrio sp. pealriver TaxID=1622269 RepID=UPI000A796BEF|nr:LysR family transcriptional regulator [Cellvibrio sp. pealriver]